MSHAGIGRYAVMLPTMDVEEAPAGEAAESEGDEVSTGGSLPGRIAQPLGGIITKQEIRNFVDNQLEPHRDIRRLRPTSIICNL